MSLDFKIISGQALNGVESSCKLPMVFHNENLQVYAAETFHKWEKTDRTQLIVIGDVIGSRRPEGTLTSSAILKVDPSLFEAPELVKNVEGRFLVIRISPEGRCDIYTDRFCRLDVYYHNVKGQLIVSSGLELLSLSKSCGISDIGMSHALTVYGTRPAKKDTLYNDVFRLGVGEILTLDSSKYTISNCEFKPLPSRKYTDIDLDLYTDIFLESLRARASAKGNVVYLSSGWDSTSILAGLVELLGADKVRAVIGRMQYSQRSGVINQFEIDRAQAVADYFGVQLDICELDYRENAEDIVNQVKPLFRSQQFANLTGINHWLLAKYTAKSGLGGETVFAGEMSDGAHNLGFSQYATVFHPASNDFREYSDKMASYLFGPTFLKEIHSGRFDQDPVWQYFKGRMRGIKFEELAPTEKERTLQVLESMFLRSGRTPFYAIENTQILTTEGQNQYVLQMKERYLSEAGEKVSPESLYAWYLHLYNSFHWQGSTVSTLYYTSSSHGLECALPFHDSRLIDFLSNMPESWGRGLDLNHTKYPLKWMLENRIDYPMYLQKGPHSYLYDVDPTFSHSAEIVYASSFTPLFQKNLKSHDFEKLLNAKVFNMGYINNLIAGYCSGKVVSGSELSDLLNLGMMSIIGLYTDP